MQTGVLAIYGGFWRLWFRIEECASCAEDGRAEVRSTMAFLGLALVWRTLDEGHGID
jgi:hypothetical protein